MIYWIVIVSQLSDFLKWTVFRYLLLCVPHAQCSWADLTKEYSTMYWISAANVQELLLNPWRITIVNLCSLFFTSEHVSHSGAPSRWGICTWCKKPDLFESIATNRDKKQTEKKLSVQSFEPELNQWPMDIFVQCYSPPLYQLSYRRDMNL